MFQCVPVDVAEAIRMYEDGMTLMEVGKRLGCSWMTVQRRLKAAGVDVRKQGVRGSGCCRARFVPHASTCPRCGRTFMALRWGQKFCCSACRNAAHSQRRDDVKRANTDGPIEEIPLREIYDRDRGRCYICGGRTDWNDYRIVNGFKVVGPRYPSRDHVIALHNGGTHTRDNIRLACWECNTLKSDRGQMRLPVAI